MNNCGVVLIVDADSGSRDVLSTLFARLDHTTTHATSGASALEIARRERPCLAVVDTHLPDVSGYEVCRQLRDEFGETLPIVFVSARRNESSDRVVGLLLGADAYFPKPLPQGEFLARVRRLLAHTLTGADELRSRLTPRERQVLSQLASGRRRAEIASDLAISPRTVAKHVENILAKLGVASHVQAVGLALREGLLDDAA